MNPNVFDILISSRDLQHRTSWIHFFFNIYLAGRDTECIMHKNRLLSFPGNIVIVNIWSPIGWIIQRPKVLLKLFYATPRLQTLKNSQNFQFFFGFKAFRDPSKLFSMTLKEYWNQLEQIQYHLEIACTYIAQR